MKRTSYRGLLSGRVGACPDDSSRDLVGPSETRLFGGTSLAEYDFALCDQTLNKSGSDWLTSTPA
jgi:hypothetical protein